MYLNKVLQFHKATESPMYDKPTIPAKDRAELRIDLLMEEVQELDHALRSKDLTEVLDALCDIQYILEGAKLEFGMQHVFDEAFDEVHRSNMSKFLKNTTQARESAMRYYDKEIEAYYKKVGDVFVIFRSIDDKILKGMNYSEPNLRPFIEDAIVVEA